MYKLILFRNSTALVALSFSQMPLYCIKEGIAKFKVLQGHTLVYSSFKFSSSHKLKLQKTSWCPTCSDDTKQLVNGNIIFKMCHFGTVCSGNWQYETMMGVLIVRHESSLQEGIFGSKWDDRFLPPSFFPSPKPQFKAHFGVKLFLKLLVKMFNFFATTYSCSSRIDHGLIFLALKQVKPVQYLKSF